MHYTHDDLPLALNPRAQTIECGWCNLLVPERYITRHTPRSGRPMCRSCDQMVAEVIAQTKPHLAEGVRP